MLYFARIRDIPEDQADILKLLDNLFDAKKAHRELVDKMEKLGHFFTSVEKNPKSGTPLKYE